MSASICISDDVQETLLLLLEKDCFPLARLSEIRDEDGYPDAMTSMARRLSVVFGVAQRLKVANFRIYSLLRRVEDDALFGKGSEECRELDSGQKMYYADLDLNADLDLDAFIDVIAVRKG